MKNTWHKIAMCQGGLGGVLHTQTRTVHGRKERKKKKGKGEERRKEKQKEKEEEKKGKEKGSLVSTGFPTL